MMNKAYHNHVIPQMADVRCSLCGEREVAVKDIIHVGFGDRYQVNAIHILARWFFGLEKIEEQCAQQHVVGVDPGHCLSF
jgi:hypothetical protein